MAVRNFESSLMQGKVAETKIANWLRYRCGYSVLPVYEIAEGQHKGPQIFTPSKELVAPDMLVFRANRIRWIEAKQKSVFSWYRIGGCWVTGIDKHHYEDYLRIALESPWPVWLLFYHTQKATTEGDGKSPVGLFGNDLMHLQDCIDHTSDKWGKHGMVYWKREDLMLIATCEEVESISSQT